MKHRPKAGKPGPKQAMSSKPAARKPEGRPADARKPDGRKPEGRKPEPRGATLPNTLGGSAFYLLGRHAIEAALGNRKRQVGTLLYSARREGQLPKGHERAKPMPVDVAVLDTLSGPDTPHQGLALEVLPLPAPHLEDLLDSEGGRLVLALDQVTDPRNVGAILRAAAAFGADAVITQDRHSPPETAALAKAASGALEILPWIRVTNLSRALDQLAEAGFWRVGLTGHTETELKDVDPGPRAVLVLGAEGPGMRTLTEKHVDYRAKLPISDRVESLNVATAAAVALYEMKRR